MINLLLALAIDVTGSQVPANDHLFLPWKDIPPDMTLQGEAGALKHGAAPRASPAAVQDTEPPDIPNMPCRLSSNSPPDRLAAEGSAAANSPLKSVVEVPAAAPHGANPDILVRTVYVQPPTILAVLASLLSLLDIYITHRRRLK